MGVVEGVRSSYSLFGPYGVALVAKARLSRRCTEVSVSVSGIKYPVQIRLRTTDVSVLSEMLQDVEYDLNFAVPPRVIVDAGANTGLTSVFYANKYAQARIFAIEPEPSNYEMLAKNAAAYDNIVCLRAALWKDDRKITISDPGLGHWGFQTGELVQAGRSTEEEGITIHSLMARFEIDYIDFLHIDIEGAEQEVFENASPWIDRVGVIAIELHDQLKPGCSRSVYGATKGFQWDFRRGETVFFGRGEYADVIQPDAPDRRARGKRRCTIMSRV
jgi:FkbM family methyltransferase